MCEMMNIFSACLVLISKSFESRREWFAHANVRSTFHRFGNILNSDLIRLEVSTPSLRSVKTLFSKVLQYPASPLKRLIVGYFCVAFCAGLIPETVS